MTFKISSSPVTYRPSPGAGLSNAKPGSNATRCYQHRAPFRLQTRMCLASLAFVRWPIFTNGITALYICLL